LTIVVETKTIHVSTQGFCDIIDVTSKVESALTASHMSEGTVTIFVPGSTAGLTTIEYESGCIRDLKQAFERIAPMDAHYEHNAHWGDGNGFAHVRAAMLGASLHIPFSGKHLLTGTWQQIVLVDFDNRPRKREVILQFVGE
jgi:secondary thiamine-phosphate synthase enzyme